MRNVFLLDYKSMNPVFQFLSKSDIVSSLLLYIQVLHIFQEPPPLSKRSFFQSTRRDSANERTNRDVIRYTSSFGGPIKAWTRDAVLWKIQNHILVASLPIDDVPFRYVRYIFFLFSDIFFVSFTFSLLF